MKFFWVCFCVGYVLCVCIRVVCACICVACMCVYKKRKRTVSDDRLFILYLTKCQRATCGHVLLLSFIIS